MRFVKAMAIARPCSDLSPGALTAKRLRTGPARSRTSTWRARTASARRATRRSKVWYTVADGVLSDVYYPTTDTTNVETLQYVVTDGSTFTDLQTRDMTFTVQALDARGMQCRVTSIAKSGSYRIVTDYLTDLVCDMVLMRVELRAAERPRRATGSTCASTRP